ncbi:MAG: hypothetical protein ACO1OB_27440 [Archangium sp.]
MKRLALFAAFALSACVTPVSFDQARQKVLLRASFEFQCPPDRLNVQELGSDDAGPIYLGVSGCNRRAVYLRVETANGSLFINDTVPAVDVRGSDVVAP